MLKRITYANVAATLALVFSMSGGALAASHYLISSPKQISPKVLKKLKGNAGAKGAAGTPGAQGLQGIQGAKGETGAKGEQGGRGNPGTGLIASESTDNSDCTLKSGSNYCYPDEGFTPVVDAKCLVSVMGQIQKFTDGEPSERGPYFRVAIREGSEEEKDDEDYGFYFQGSDGEESSELTRTKLIQVKAGTEYEFGAYFGDPGTDWQGKEASYEVTYTCFG